MTGRFITMAMLDHLDRVAGGACRSTGSVMSTLAELVELYEASEGGGSVIDPVTMRPWNLRDRHGYLWSWGLDRRCGKWGYQFGGEGHAKSLDELAADTDRDYGVAPLTRESWQLDAPQRRTA